MSKFDEFKTKLKTAWDNTEGFRTKSGEVVGKTGHVIGIIFSWIYKLRSVILAIPVAIAAVQMAMYNMENLPAIVGIDLQASGEYALLIDRNVAVMGPLAVTAVCLLMMFCSRRVVYPWIISIFTLVLPPFLLLSNTLLG